MEITGVTVSLAVRSLPEAIAWYARAFGPSETTEPTEGVVELRLGPIWLQLSEDQPRRSSVVVRFGVADVTAERDRLVGLGIAVGEVEHVPGVIEWCDLADPDGNVLSLYTEL